MPRSRLVKNISRIHALKSFLVCLAICDAAVLGRARRNLLLPLRGAEESFSLPYTWAGGSVLRRSTHVTEAAHSG